MAQRIGKVTDCAIARLPRACQRMAVNRWAIGESDLCGGHRGYQMWHRFRPQAAYLDIAPAADLQAAITELQCGVCQGLPLVR